MYNGSAYLRNKAYDAMVRLPKTYEQWHSVYCISTQREDDQLFYKSLENMVFLAEHFCDLISIYDTLYTTQPRVTSASEWKDSMMSKVLSKMAGKGSTSEWHDAIVKYSGTRLRELGTKEMINKATSFWDWFLVKKECRNSTIETKALENMVRLAKTYDDWKRIYDNAYGEVNSNLKSRAAREMARLI
jgi:hypothetical protein